MNLKADYETYIVVLGRREGKRYAERKHLNVPLDLATGNYERLSNLQIREAINDLLAVRMDREAKASTEASITNAQVWAPPLDETEVTRTAKSILSRHRRAAGRP